MSKRSIIWFRRDLRVSDHPALLAAISESSEIVPVFILDPKLIKTGGSKRLAYLGQSLRALDESLGNNLQVIAGDQLTVLKDLQKKYDAESVHISAEYEPYGATRDKNIEEGGIAYIDKIKVQGNDAETDTYYSNYMQVQGLAMPGKIDTKMNGQIVMTIVTDKVEVNPELDKALFEKPVK